MDTYTGQDGTTFTMDTDSRYGLTMARDLLAPQLGRKTTGLALFNARFHGPVTIGGTCITWRGDGFTITDS